jgi:hypothetical protein
MNWNLWIYGAPHILQVFEKKSQYLEPTQIVMS